jgi:hypothetical protein
MMIRRIEITPTQVGMAAAEVYLNGRRTWMGATRPTEAARIEARGIARGDEIIDHTEGN